MVHEDIDTDNLREITSVGGFITEIAKMRKDTENEDGISTDWYFRGQETEYWDIEPSIFRNDLLSVEHKLMQIPLQKIPTEFKELDSTFDILTKYQHYGMCTRLLDLTTNPLVALYFACKIHGEEKYRTEEGEVDKEPYGVVYYTNKEYSFSPIDKEIKIIVALAKYDLSKENKVSEVLDKLERDKIIEKNDKNKWASLDGGLDEFASIIQRNYMVMPHYSNERLRKQSGIFLLAGLFSIDSDQNSNNDIITKTKGSLKNEFCAQGFYVNGEKKEDILKELGLYNINEATLFPELEHQLNYIKYINQKNLQAVGEFHKYEKSIREEKRDIEIRLVDNGEINQHILESFNEIMKYIVDAEDVNNIKRILENNFTVDWYKKNNAISKIKVALKKYYMDKECDKKSAEEKAEQILDILNMEIKEFTKNS